jgi:3-oxoacyl-[acyl-carrier protein] reductase
VIVHGRRSRQAADDIARAVSEMGRKSAVLLADLADRSAGDELVEQAWSIWGGLDAWLHLAGADTLTGPSAKLAFDAKLDLLWSVDVAATIRLCRNVGSRMAAQGSGSIVTMGWDQAETGMEGDSGELFAAAKGAILAFTRSLALSLAPHVRVNALAPGWIKTAWGQGASQAWQDRVLAETPLARWGTPEDVAAAACFLISDAAAFLTGQTIRVNGGAVR